AAVVDEVEADHARMQRAAREREARCDVSLLHPGHVEDAAGQLDAAAAAALPAGAATRTLPARCPTASTTAVPAAITAVSWTLGCQIAVAGAPRTFQF